MAKLRVGIIGCGLIAQVMHLHYLRELADLYEIAALCDEVVVIAHGRVVAQGTPADLRGRAGTESLEEAFVRLVGAAGATPQSEEPGR